MSLIQSFRIWRTYVTIYSGSGNHHFITQVNQLTNECSGTELANHWANEVLYRLLMLKYWNQLLKDRSKDLEIKETTSTWNSQVIWPLWVKRLVETKVAYSERRRLQIPPSNKRILFQINETLNSKGFPRCAIDCVTRLINDESQCSV